MNQIKVDEANKENNQREEEYKGCATDLQVPSGEEFGEYGWGVLIISIGRIRTHLGGFWASAGFISVFIDSFC